MLTGAFRRALRPLEDALELARPLGARMAGASTLASLAIVYSQLGERERAITAARESLRISTELDAGDEMMRAYINGSQAIDDDGRLEEAVAFGFEGLEDSRGLGVDRAGGDHLLMQTAWRLLRLGRLDEAQRLIGPALETVTTTFNVAAIKNIAGYLGRHADATDAVAAADDAANRLAQAIARYPNHGAPPKAHAVYTLALAEVSRARGNREPQAWHAATDRLSAVHEAYLAADADMRAAEALALAGAGVHDVAEPLRRAHVAAVSIGIRPFLDEVEGLARRARVHVAEQPPEDRGIAEQLGLTERELEVLSLVAEGRTNRQVGEQLFITDKTASAHVSRILMKLGVANRAEAAAAHRLGLARRAPATSVV
jgi:DNA-binding NarL/FixJ family response regulator